MKHYLQNKDGKSFKMRIHRSLEFSKLATFHRSPFFYLTLGPNPSYSWRGIWETKKWLHKGCIWRIVNGKKGQDLVKPLALLGFFQTATVHTLIDPTTNSWSSQLLNTLFHPLDVVAITKIALSLQPNIDGWIWKEEWDEKFSVKSVYRLIHVAKSSLQGESSNCQSSQSLWKALWKLRVYHKICIFASLACRDRLPCLHNLHKRHIPVDSNAPFAKTRQRMLLMLWSTAQQLEHGGYISRP